MRLSHTGNSVSKLRCEHFLSEHMCLSLKMRWYYDRVITRLLQGRSLLARQAPGYNGATLYASESLKSQNRPVGACSICISFIHFRNNWIASSSSFYSLRFLLWSEGNLWRDVVWVNPPHISDDLPSSSPWENEGNPWKLGHRYLWW